MSLYTELKDRKVIRVAAVYLVVAWLIMQVVAVVSEPLLLPDWFARVVILLLTIGFPLAIILSWAFDATPAEGSENRSGKPLAFGLIAATAIVIGFIVTGFNSGDSEPTAEVIISEESTVLPNSVAVLPLENLSPDEDNAYFAAGIHEEILNQLVKLSKLNVISRTSMVRYADSDLSIPEIAAELNVGAVMEGSVRYADDRVLVTLQLIDPETDVHLWSESYNREFADIFAIQADIAMNVANALQVEFSLEEQAQLEKIPTTSAEAWTAYLQHLQVNSLGPGDVTILDRAISLDPDFALAYAERAILLTGRINGGRYAPEAIDEILIGVRRDIDRSFELDPELPSTYLALSNLHRLNWQFEEARVSLEHALAISPNNPQIVFAYAVILADTNTEEALRLAEKALSLSPLDPDLRFTMGILYSNAKEYPAALRSFQHALDLLPPSGGAVTRSKLQIASLEILLGNPEEALTAMLQAEQASNADSYTPVVLLLVARLYAELDRPDDVNRLLSQFDERVSDIDLGLTILALASIVRGDHESGFDYLQRAADERVIYDLALQLIIINAFEDPILDSEPRWIELINRFSEEIR